MIYNDIEHIARICHEANRAYCISINDDSQVPWELASYEQQASARTGVKLHMACPEAGAKASHMSWMEKKMKNGWAHGLIKDQTAKTHPCLVSFAELSFEHQIKDHIFRSIVHALTTRPTVAAIGHAGTDVPVPGYFFKVPEGQKDMRADLIEAQREAITAHKDHKSLMRQQIVDLKKKLDETRDEVCRYQAQVSLSDADKREIIIKKAIDGSYGGGNRG